MHLEYLNIVLYIAAETWRTRPLYCTIKIPLSTSIPTMNLTRVFDRFDIGSVAFILSYT